jgi:hypothetical protein
MDTFGCGCGRLLATGTYFQPELYERPTIDGRPGAARQQDHAPLFFDVVQRAAPSVLVRVMARMHEACKYS